MTRTIQKTIDKLGSRYICTTMNMAEANEVIRKKTYEELGNWFEVNKAIRDHKSNYGALPIFVGEDDEDFDYYVHEIDCVIVYRKK